MKIVTPKQLAKEMSVSNRTVANWRKHGYITAIKIGHRTVRYDLDAVLSELKSNFQSSK